MKREELDRNTKEKSVAMSTIGNNDSNSFKESGIKKTSYYRWRNEFKVRELEHYFGLKNPKVKDLEQENICLQKMLAAAKKEQALLKKTISSLCT